VTKKTSCLSEEAKAYCQASLERQGRGAVVEMLEGIGVACYDEEGVEELAEAAVDSVEAGDIEFDFGMSAVDRSDGDYLYRLWLDIDDVWI